MATAEQAEIAEPPVRRRRRKRRWGLPLYTAVVIAYLFAPIIVMVIFSFNDPAGRFNVTWEGFTLRFYREIFDVPDLTEALKNSIFVAAASTVVATAVGSLLALALTRHRFLGRSSMNLFIFLPMATPEVVMGASLLALFVTLQIDRGFLTIIISHILFSISFVVVTVKARTSSFDRNLEDAAQDLGANPWTSFWTVIFPLIFPGILAAALLAAVLSIDDFVITSFNAGPVTTLPLWIFGASRIGVPVQVNVIGTAIFVIGIVYAVVTLLRGGRAEARPPMLKKG